MYEYVPSRGCSIQGDASAKPKKLLVMRCAALALALLAASNMHAEDAPPKSSATPTPATQIPWKLSITVDGYILQDQDSYVNAPNQAA